MGRVVVVLAMLAMLTAATCPAAEAKVFRQYDHRLQFEVPDEWLCTSQSPHQFLAIFTAPEMRYEINTLTLVHQILPATHTLTDYVVSTVASQEKMLWQYRLLDKQLLDNAYAPYYRLAFTWRLSWEQQYFVLQMIICRYPDVYVLTGTCPASLREVYEPLFQRVFDSFAFVG
ncbi:DcrB-related protein [Thermosinus carboxydivorans]|nr:DcrB-related protein [Thermosinus carboxydivorans]